MEENMPVTAKPWVTAHVESAQENNTGIPDELAVSPMEIADHLWDAIKMFNLCTNQALAVQTLDSAYQGVQDAVIKTLVTGCGYTLDVATSIVHMTVENGETIRYSAAHWDNSDEDERAYILAKYFLR